MNAQDKEKRFARMRILSQYSLYARLLILLLCIGMGIILIMAGSLFLVDYIPVSLDSIEKIDKHEILWEASLIEAENKNDSDKEIILKRLDGRMFDITVPEMRWLLRQNNPELVKALDETRKFESLYTDIRRNHASYDESYAVAAKVKDSYTGLAKALRNDLEVKHSVISLLQLVALLLVITSIVAIALGGRRLLVDRVGRLLSFLPDNLIQASPDSKSDEFSLLEQKLFGVMTRLEGFLAGRTWAEQSSERLRRMLRAQEFLLRFVDTITRESLSEISVRTLLNALEKALNCNNVALVFDESNSLFPQGGVVFSHHMPMPLAHDVMDDLTQSGVVNCLALSADKTEIRCTAMMFSCGPDSMDILLVETERDRLLEDNELQLLELIGKLLAMVVGYQGRDQEGRRIALLEERAAIARELHDSLAQSLSFMKIQIARLQSLPEAGQSGPVVAELREGLDNAYKELRELLSTFRVHMDVRGLGFAIKSAIDEFSQRSSLSITLDNRLINCRLTVNEEFHILHVIREALSNIVRHAGASHAAIAMVYQSNGSVMITIDDDGVGMRPGNDGQDHYGQAIMKERAYSLGGDIEVMSRRKGGTRVRLIFTPKLPQA
jgi:two-component system nitrate/nitrite sensor histidine kinase NarX